MKKQRLAAFVLSLAFVFSFVFSFEFSSEAVMYAAEAESETEPDFDSMTADQIQKEYLSLMKENKKLRNKVTALESKLGASKTGETETELQLSTEIEGTQYTDASIVRMVQEALNNNGYDCGTPDGAAGEKTQNALKSYQTDKKLNVNGVITDELLNSLGLSGKVSEAAKLEASKAEYSSDYSYDSLARNPDTYKDQKAKISGKVLQVQEGTSLYYGYMRLAVDGSYDQVIYVEYDSTKLDSRILEDDYVTVYGVLTGVYTYETVLGASITIPSISADIVELS